MASATALRHDERSTLLDSADPEARGGEQRGRLGGAAVADKDINATVDVADSEFADEAAPRCCCWRRRWARCRLVSAVVTSLIALTLGLVLWLSVEPLVHRLLRKQEAIDGPRSAGYQLWRDSTAQGIDTTYSWIVFNVTNADEVETSGALPMVTAVGPLQFRFRRYRPESHISWWPNGTIRYVNREEYTFVPSAAFPSLSDVHVVVPPLGLLGLIKALERFGSQEPLSLVEKAIINVLNNASVLGNGTADRPPRGFFSRFSLFELFYNATDPWLGFLKGVCTETPSSRWNIDVWWLCVAGGDLLEKQMQTAVNIFEADGTTRNGPSDEAWSGGPASATALNWPPPGSYALQYTKWHGHANVSHIWSAGTSLPASAFRYAGMINGSDGSHYPPRTTPADTLYAFSPSLQRSLPMCFVGHVTHYDLPDVLRFGMCRSVWNTSSNTSDNVRLYGMVHEGVLELPFADPKPVVFTQALFQGCANGTRAVSSNSTPPSSASVPLLASLVGPLPDANSFSNLVDVEPVTGTPVRSTKAMQLNVRIGYALPSAGSSTDDPSTSAASSASEQSSSGGGAAGAMSVWQQLRMTQNMTTPALLPVGIESGHMSMPQKYTEQLFLDTLVLRNGIRGVAITLFACAAVGMALVGPQVVKQC